jgi:flagellar secretion chaperone FliS
MVPLPYQAYTRAQATTSSQGELLVLLYRGAARFAAKARLQIGAGELEGAHNSLLRAQEIVLELIGGLRPSGDPTVDNLCGVHRYIYQLLCQANLKKQLEPIDDAIKHLRGLLATWEQIVMPGRNPEAGRVVSIDRHC